MIIYYICSIILLVPSTAYAYLDPGTGNILVYIVVSLIGALVFSLKGIFYKIMGRKDIASSKNGSTESKSIVIFNEGKNYWNTFKPIVEALIEMKRPFSYYTMDIEDPGLTIDYENDFMNKRYIGKGNIAYARMGKLSADVVLSTTPNIGTEGFPLPRSPKIKHLSHVFHAVSDMCFYHKGSLDHYDSVMLVGEFEIPILRKLENLRGLPPKELHPAGLPYVDVLASKVPADVETDGKTILIAPSWGTKGCLKLYGHKFIQELAEAGYEIIIRPHPQSWKVETEMLDKIKNDLKKYPNVKWDQDPDGTKSLSRSDIMISDTSSVRFDYVLLYKKPVITLESPMPDPEAFEMSDLKESVLEKTIAEAGITLNHETIGEIVPAVKSILDKTNSGRDLDGFRDKMIYNWGTSGKAIAQYLAGKAGELSETKEA